jgi:hypothetical protein
MKDVEYINEQSHIRQTSIITEPESSGFSDSVGQHSPFEDNYLTRSKRNESVVSQGKILRSIQDSRKE